MTCPSDNSDFGIYVLVALLAITVIAAIALYTIRRKSRAGGLMPFESDDPETWGIG